MEINGKRAFQEKTTVNGKVVGGNIYCFFWEPRRNEVASKQNGRPVYDKALMVEIRSPGMKNQIHRAEIEIHYASGQVRERNSPYTDGGRSLTWREHLAPFITAWEKEEKTPDDGTPLETWPKLDVAMIAALREAGIYSVEMLAAIPDSRLGVLPLGGLALREQAKAFLAEAQGNSKNDALIAENLDLKARLSRLEEQFAAIQRAEAEEGNGPDVIGGTPVQPRRGRPPKQNVA